LEDYDRKIARVALIWRERKYAWAERLAEESAKGAALEDLYVLVDCELWKDLKSHRESLKVERISTGSDKPNEFALVEFAVVSHADGLENLRIAYHPLQIRWTITTLTDKPGEREIRTTE